MLRVQLFLYLVLVFCFAGCSQNQQPAAPATTASPVAASTAQVALPQTGASAVAPVANGSVPANVKNPVANPSMVPGKDGKPAQMPPGLDRMYRPLSLEEINQLPPATREMILKAQGRWTPTPAPKK